jgi:hypothetical protein
MARWGFLTSHARVLLCIAHDPAARLRDVAASLRITERSADGIVADLAEAGYVIKLKDGRRNRYQVQAHLPVPGPAPGNPPSAKLSPSSQPRAGSSPGTPGRVTAISAAAGRACGPRQRVRCGGCRGRVAVCR